MYSWSFWPCLKCRIITNEELRLSMKTVWKIIHFNVFWHKREACGDGIQHATLGLADGSKVQRLSAQQRDSYFPHSPFSFPQRFGSCQASLWYFVQHFTACRRVVQGAIPNELCSSHAGVSRVCSNSVDETEIFRRRQKKKKSDGTQM